MKSAISYIWLQMALGVANSLSREVLSRFSSVEEIYNHEDFGFLGEKRKKYIHRLEDKNTSSAFEVLKKCRNMGVTITGYYDELYPERLKTIENPPVALYSIGEIRNLNKTPCVAMVGTRKMTDYGREVTERFSYTLAKSGVCIISGLAKGVDTAAHRGSIMADGYTVAVLGNPIGDIYPKENVKAFETLYKRGLVLSEMYPDCPRTKADFPNRNRIISGMSDTVIVTEAGENSGALITANYALSQGRMLFAVPGDIGASNAGTNSLIKRGVSITTEPYDILTPLLLEYPEATKPYVPSLTEKLRKYGNAMPERHIDEAEKYIPPKRKDQEVTIQKEEQKEIIAEEDKTARDETLTHGQRILASLTGGKLLSADEIASATGINIAEVMTELTVLEISGEVTLSVGGRFCKL